jgi:hypothetical protein
VITERLHELFVLFIETKSERFEVGGEQIRRFKMQAPRVTSRRLGRGIGGRKGYK